MVKTSVVVVYLLVGIGTFIGSLNQGRIDPMLIPMWPVVIGIAIGDHHALYKDRAEERAPMDPRKPAERR